ncbi:MAG: M55 family metallopeptidase [Ignavibacteriales bacterium]|nr:M55 family metallopeptidase [Ignavibacteriales bacterium]
MDQKKYIRAATLLLISFWVVSASYTQSLRVFISVDMEGITGIVHGDQVSGTGGDYNIARKWMTEDVNAAVRGALDAGAKEIIVNDSHGDMRNILISDLDSSATLITGSPKPLSMMQGIDENIDAAIFLGYHAKAGTKDGVLDHTISSSTVYSIKINGIEMPELGINALVAGCFNVPVVLIAGDKAVCEQAREILGEKISTVAVKDGIGRYAAKTLSLQKSHQIIRQQVKDALLKYKQIKPYKLNPPYRFELTYLRSSQADMAMLLPNVKRIDARAVQIESDDFIVGFKFLRALIVLGREN